MLSAVQTKMQLKNALIDLLLTKDAEKITAVDLARKAEVSRATLYRYYDSVDEVLREIEDGFLEGMRDCSRYYISSPFDMKHLDRPNPALVAIADYHKENSRIYLAMSGSHGDQRFVYRTHKFIREFYCGKLAYEGLVRNDLDVYMEFALAGNDAVIRYWLEKRPDISSEDVAVILQKILYGPFVC